MMIVYLLHYCRSVGRGLRLKMATLGIGYSVRGTYLESSNFVDKLNKKIYLKLYNGVSE